MSRPNRPTRFWEWLAVVIVKPLSRLLVKKDWRHGERVPRQGGLIIAANHLSWSDPVLISHFLYNNGRWPVILAKSGLFEVPVLRVAVKALLAIPVYRGSTDAAKSLDISRERLRNGAAVLFYPEGTCTRDPELWPMQGKTGVARLALETGAKVIPVAHWGAQELLPYGSSKPKPFPRKTFAVSVGEPVDLSKYEGQPMRGKVLKEATNDIMMAITHQLAELRGEKAPEKPWEPSDD
ncbi:lysophospholipid acyltransferase family protein [Nonomuraea soli]|uniref:1-acyl-sn-glycerol-3-phosphate acyltransferase n=1 Tax=Nonomuraea soli TaxID=1032476 RepID=A0A7W0CMT1_9ACTN|nr:lysophospholipid acyltransferase family protein [Nonomuraea soli]MBA2894001.1 1-acyl-sn-glycerol-3-phosphate acyltransferase [Nonomuraea soli]